MDVEVEAALNNIEEAMKTNLPALMKGLPDIEDAVAPMLGDWVLVYQVVDMDSQDQLSWVESRSPKHMFYHSHLGLLEQATDNLRDEDDD